MQFDSDNFKIKLGIANCNYVLSKYEDAIVYYKQIIKINFKEYPKNFDDVYYNFGILFIVYTSFNFLNG